MADDGQDNLILLYDGVCGFCDRSVQFILDHDQRKTLRFAPLQSAFGKSVIERHPSLGNVDSLVLVQSRGPDERVFVRSEGALRVAAYLGGGWKLLLALRLIPSLIRDALYNVFARHRYKLFGKHESCRVPPPEVRSRFLG